MKKLSLTFCISLLALAAFAQPAKQIDSVKTLISQGQYLSAYNIIQTTQETSPEIILLAANVLTEHSVSTNKYYDSWTLQDKMPAIKQERIELNLEKVLWAGVNAYPADCRMYTALSRFYTRIFELEELYTSLEMLRGIKEAAEKYIHPKCPDHLSSYILGYCNNYLGQPQASLAFLQKSITLNTRYAPAYLELGNACLQTKDLPNALKHARKAYELAEQRSRKSRAALLMAQVYEAQKDNANALAGYLLADSLSRRDFFNQKALLSFYVKTGNSKASDAVNSFVGAQGRDNLHNYIDALQIYSAYNRQADLALYCQKALADFKGRKGVEACLNFTLGKIYQHTNAKVARDYFKTAKDQGVDAGRYPATRNHPDTAKEIEAAFKTIN